jgi:hypothetical protein
MASLEDLKYDDEFVFPDDFEYTEEQVQTAAKLKQHELEWVMMSQFGTVECSHPEWQDPSDELLERAGCLPAFFSDYALSWMDQ